jgi:tetratricopeptide (TPR) repeat protein
MKKSLNIKHLAALLVVLIVLTVGVHFLHGYQVRRNVGAFLWQANRFEEKGDLKKAASYLSRYLAFRPTDTDELARYGLLLEKLAKTDDARVRVAAVLEKVLVRDPERGDIRKKLVLLLMDQGRWEVGRLAEAMEHLDILLKASPNDGELELLYGKCLEARKDFPKAAAWLTRAVAHAPGQVEGYVRLAGLLRRQLGDADKADKVMDRLVASNRRSFRAYLARGRYWKEAGALDRAEKDVTQAAALAADEVEVLLEMADVARERARSGEKTARQKHLDKARRCLERGLRLHPQRVAMYLALARLELQAGRPAQALACLGRGGKAVPNTVPEKSDLLWHHAHLLLEEGRDAGRLIAMLNERSFPLLQVDYLRARALVNQGEWLRAARALERLHPDLAPSAELTKQADLLLGRCYARLGDADQQYAAYRRVVNVEPFHVPACLGMAAALLALDKIDDAISTYRKIIPKSPGSAVRVAQLMTLKNLRLPPGERRWQEVEQFLDQVLRANPGPIPATILRAKVLAIQGKLKEAEKLLTAARDRNPREVEIWVTLAELAGNQGKSEALLATLDRAQRQLGDRVELRLARSRFVAQQGGPQAATRLGQLEKGLKQFSRTDRHSLLEGLAQAFARIGNLTEAERLWGVLAREQPKDLGLKLVLFDLALRAGNERAMRQLMEEIRKVEEGSLWRYAQVSHLIWLARQKRDRERALARAESLLRTLREERPGWARVAVCEGELDELNGYPEGAIKNYLRAVMELGERSPEVIRRVVQMLYARRRYVEADQVLQKLPATAALSGDLRRISAEISLRRQDYARALSLAGQAVSARSKDYRDHVWLGHILSAAGKGVQAEAALRRATELAGGVPDTWVALVQHLARTGQRDKALAAIRVARRKLRRDQADLALAQCHELIGDTERAAALFRAALTERPKDVATLRGVAGFYLRTLKYRAAEPLLETIIELKMKSPSDAAWARRILALVLALGGDYRQSRKALRLLDLVDEAGPEDPAARPADNERARALVLASQGGLRPRREAIKILERLVGQQSPQADDMFLLAQLNEAVGDWPGTRKWMVRFLEAYPSQPAYLAHFARSLLRRGEDQAAEPLLDRIRQLPGQTGAFVTAELEARLLAARGQAPAAVARLETYVTGKDSRPARETVRLELTAGLLDQLSQAYPAEKRFEAAAEKKYRALVAQQPRSTAALVWFLAGHGRPEEALALGERAGDDCPAEVVGNAVVTALHGREVSRETLQRVEGWLKQALAKSPKSVALLICFADLRNLQGRYAEAVGLYREAIRRDPHSVVALNNLAWLLAAFEGKGAEALRLIDRAIQTAGPLPELRDTRAVVCLSLGKGEPAIAELKLAVEEKPLLGVSHFHLAQAYVLVKNRGEAKDALRKARALGLEAKQLHPLEQKAYKQLLDALGLR